jgi:hypothetical protein
VASPDAGQPVSTLRGAGVDVNAKVVGRVVVAICLVGLAITAGALLVAGIHKNAQIDELHAHGVPVTVKTDACLGLMGGSGSSPAGYSCTGSYEVGGHHYTEVIPDNLDHPPGTLVRGIVASDDPQLLTVPSVLAGERTSLSVFLVPTILFLILIILVGLIAVRHRHRRVD